MNYPRSPAESPLIANKKGFFSPNGGAIPTTSSSSTTSGSGKYHMFPRRIFTQDWDTKPPCAVIVTIHSLGSYDKLFRSVPQHSPDTEHSVALFEMDYDTVPKFLTFFATNGQYEDETDRLAMQQVVEAINQVDPCSVVFNFECCTYCARKGFQDLHGKLVRFLKILLDRGYMAMFADFSLKSLIADWNSGILGPNPFQEVGTCKGKMVLAFDSNQLLDSDSCAQLQALGRINKAGVHTAELECMSNTFVFTLKDEDRYAARSSSDPPPKYDLEVLSIACSFEQSRFPNAFDDYRLLKKGNHVGYAGHVMLTYRNSGGRILVSGGHWIELTHIDVDEEYTVNAIQQQFGTEFAKQLKVDLASSPTEEGRQHFLQESVRQLIQSTAPCAYSIRVSASSRK